METAHEADQAPEGQLADVEPVGEEVRATP